MNKQSMKILMDWAGENHSTHEKNRVYYDERPCRMADVA